MAVSITIQNYLKDMKVRYVPLEHEHAETSSMTAEVAHVPGSRLVKGVMIKDDTKYMMALLPASHHLRMKELNELLGREVTLASEEELTAIFSDCDDGAVPALGLAYGIEVIVEDTLNKNDDLFFEGGDHETLVHLEAKAFENLVSDCIHGHFSHHDKNPENRGGFRYAHS
ncbi:aminoacyl-tRNA deacylase [Kiloniella sp.]|uniref:aminoacyl-tRNA deacylase n=1 Tax=Kiloniella sp. TaxID=1938587 RepID=UPI003B01AB98